MADTHKMVSVKAGPEHLGWPHRRRRLLAAGLSRASLIWTGPEDDEAIAQDFSSRFHKATMLTGSVFAMASDSEVRSEYLRMARKQRHHLSSVDLDRMSSSELLRHIVPPGAVQRYQEWLAHAEKNNLGSLGGVLMVDIDHHPETKGLSAGSDFPLNLRHGTVLCIEGAEGGREGSETWRMMLAPEHLSAMGFHVYDDMCADFPRSNTVEVLQSLATPEQMKSLLGNGQHLATQASWMCYVLAHTVRRSPHEQISRSLREPFCYDDDSDERDSDVV